MFSLTGLGQWFIIGALALLVSLPLPAQAPPPRVLADDSLEDLMNIEVTSVSRKEQTLSKTAAAVFVINQEDIRRSGAANIPEVLRMAPGVDVAQLDANAWAISIRGFNDRYANLVLVLIDGRTVYTPTTSGVYWDQLDVPLEDIDRIEITRGPGGTVWGANAVNGVINIITKSAKDTQGTVVRAGGGSQGAAQGLVQYGGQLGSGTYRVFGDYSNQGNLRAPDGRSAAADGWRMWHGGFRSDWALGAADSLTFQGDFTQTTEGQTIDEVFAGQLPLVRTLNDAVLADSGNAMARWNHTLAGGSDTSLQVYFDRYNRYDVGLSEALNTLDFDFQHHLKAATRHDIVWGAGYRLTSDDHSPGYAKTYVPLARANNLFSAFIQDEIVLSRTLWVTLGSKLEHNAFNGFDYEPSVKLLWQPTPRQAIWLSAAHAIVQASRDDENLLIDTAVFPTPGGGFGVAQVIGNPDSTAQQLHDYEAGYRVQAAKRVSFDIGTFSSYYNHLRDTVAGTPFFTTDEGTPHVVLPVVFEFATNAHTYGAEAFGTLTISHRWKISPSVSAIHLVTSGTRSPGTFEDVNSTPQFQGQIRSSVDLTKHLDWDVSFWHTGRLRNGGDGAVPAYNRLDTRLGWRMGESAEISVVGQNLLTPSHAEFHDSYEVLHTLVERSAFGKITWRF